MVKAKSGKVKTAAIRVMIVMMRVVCDWALIRVVTFWKALSTSTFLFLPKAVRLPVFYHLMKV
jgi:hypothetical protein